MKWTKFKADFDSGGPLHRLLRYGDKLIPCTEIPASKAEPTIWVSEKHDPYIDNCFRIYDMDRDSFEKDYIFFEKDHRNRDCASYNNPAYYHRWDYQRGLTTVCFHEAYFDTGFFDRRYGIKKYKEVLEKEKKEKLVEAYGTDYSEKIYGSGLAEVVPYPKPHPFEIYYGGWVHFFDEEVRRGDSDHALYLKWDNREKEMSLTVYILQLRPFVRGNYDVRSDVNITNPPTSSDPPTPKGPPPYS
jgi:hypothetical protein